MHLLSACWKGASNKGASQVFVAPRRHISVLWAGQPHGAPATPGPQRRARSGEGAAERCPSCRVSISLSRPEGDFPRKGALTRLSWEEKEGDSHLLHIDSVLSVVPRVMCMSPLNSHSNPKQPAAPPLHRCRHGGTHELVKSQNFNLGSSNPKACSLATWVPRHLRSGRVAQPYPRLSPPGAAVPSLICAPQHELLILGCVMCHCKPVIVLFI